MYFKKTFHFSKTITELYTLFDPFDGYKLDQQIEVEMNFTEVQNISGDTSIFIDIQKIKGIGNEGLLKFEQFDELEDYIRDEYYYHGIGFSIEYSKQAKELRDRLEDEHHLNQIF